MKIACISKDAATQLVGVLRRYSIRQGVRWESGSPLDERVWVFVNATIDPAEEAAIRRDIEAIAGAAVQK